MENLNLKKPEIRISLPCVSLLFFTIFTILAIIVFLVPFTMLFTQGQQSVKNLSLSLYASYALNLDYQIREPLLMAKSLNTLHVSNFLSGVVFWDVSDPTQEIFRDFLRNSILDNPQFQFIYLNYDYLPNSWGFCGWFTSEKFYYTNTTGYTAIYPAPGGVVTWNELYGFFSNNTDSPWVTSALDAPTKQAWTPIYIVDITQTGIDLYTTHSHYFTQNGKNYIFSVDTNLLYINSLLKNGTGGIGLAFIVDMVTGSLVGSSSGVPLYESDPSDNLITMQAVKCQDPLIVQAANWLLSQYGNYSAVLPGPNIVNFGNVEYFFTITYFTDEDGIHWLLCQLTPSSYYLNDIQNALLPAVFVPLSVLLFVIFLAAIVTYIIVKNFHFVYESVYNQEYFDDPLPTK